MNNVKDENVLGMYSTPTMHSFYTLHKDCTRITATNSKTIDASHKSNPLSVLHGYVDSNSTLPWVKWEAITTVQCISCRGLLLHILTGLWSTQANVESIMLKAAWHWGSDSSVANNHLGEPGRTQKYAGLTWGSVDSDCTFSPFCWRAP